MKFVKRNSDSNFNNKLIAEIVKLYSISEDIVKIIISKGYKTKKDIINFLEPQNFKFYNPFLLKGMKEAVKIIKEAISLNKRITILGDYDTDGICSTAILYKYFQSVNKHVNYFLPNRFVDGYGLTIETIDKIISEFNPELLITVDCGISSYKEIEYAKSKGLQVIVTDHHEIPEIIPDCVVINPKLKDQDYPFSELCGAGVAFKLVHALAGYKFASTLTSIASFATVADIVPLVNENRAIVYQGLKTYKTNLPKGVLKLIEKFKITDMQTSDISIRVAPKINTAGRMGDANVAFKLFIEENDKEINKTINELEQLNEVRVSDGAEIYDEALKMLEKENISNLKAIVLYKDSWNGGVLGIVCAKLVEKFNKPVCLLSKVENEYKGSVRSIEKIDIYKELSNLSHLLIRFGGHSQAGGLSILEENIEEFKIQLNKNLSENIDENSFETIKYYDLDLNKIELNSDFLKQLQLLEPFGFGNEKPIFKLTFNNAKISRLKNYNNHLKIKINNLDIIAWNYGNYYEHLKTNSNKDILLELNGEYVYNNNTYVNATLRGLKVYKLNTNLKQDYVNANILKQLQYFHLNIPLRTYKPLTHENFESVINSTLKSSSFGTLVVTNNFKSYTKFINEFGQYISNYELFTINNKTGENAILYLPNYEEITGYSNIILLEPVLVDSALICFNAKNLYVANFNSQVVVNCFNNISIERNIFGQVHVAIKNMIKKELFGENEYDYFNKLIKVNPQIKHVKFDQFVFIVMVLKELNILEIINGDFYNIIIKENKNPLENSKIYNYVKLLKNVS